MRAQRVLLAVVVALACLGATEAIKCYSCVYAPDAGSVIPPGSGIPAHNEKCGDSFDESLASLTAVNETTWDGIFFDPSGARSTNVSAPVLSQTLKQFNKMFGASKSSGVNAGNKVFCAKGTADAGDLGTVVLRGFFAQAGVTENTCEEVEVSEAGLTLKVRGCICDSDECNSAAELKLSFALIAAVAIVSKLMY